MKNSRITTIIKHRYEKPKINEEEGDKKRMAFEQLRGALYMRMIDIELAKDDIVDKFTRKKKEKIGELKEQLSEINMKDEKDFQKLESRLNESRGELYTNSEAIIQYERLLEIIDTHITNERSRIAISSYIEDIEKELKILKAGRRAEKNAADSIKIWTGKVRYLCNARFIYDDVDVEEDIIIIAPTGIFSIEVKNWKDNAKLNRNGILTTESGRGESIDIVNQVKRHCFCLRMILEQENVLPSNECIYPIILWQNNFSKLEDDFNRIPICCANTLEEEVLDYSKYQRILTDEDIERIYEILNSKKADERKYPLEVKDKVIDYLLSTVKEEMEKNPVRDKLKNEIDKLEHPIKNLGKNVGEVAGVGAFCAIAVLASLADD